MIVAEHYIRAETATRIRELSWDPIPKIESRQDRSIILTPKVANFDEAEQWPIGFGG